MLPPLIGTPVALYNSWKTPSKYNIFCFLFVYTLFCLYCFPQYDAVQFFFAAIAGYFYIDHLLVTLSSFFHYFANVDIFLFWGMSYLLMIFLYFSFLYSIRSSFNKRYLLLITILSLPISTWMGLYNFTFAAVFALFFLEKINRSLVLLIIFSLASFFFHQAVSVIVFPSIVLYWLFKRNYKTVSFFYLISFGISLFLLSHGGLPFVSSYFSGNEHLTSKMDMYTDRDSIWGGAGLETGIVRAITNTIQYIIAFSTIHLVFKYYDLLKNHYFTSVSIISIVAMISSIGLYTFTERFNIVILLTFTAIFIKVFPFLGNRKKRLRVVIICLTIIFSETLIFFPRSRYNLFYDVNSAERVAFRSAYIPSFLLIFNFDKFGWSDQYMMQNAAFNRPSDM